MGTKIEWAAETWNPITGCSPVSEGCANCYAKRMAQRFRGRYGYPANDPFRVTFHPDRLDQPSRWRKPRMIFVCSMGDLFHEDVPFEWVDKVFAIVASCHRHTFLILTKRPERMKEYFCRVSEKGPEAANLYQSKLIDFYSRHGVDLTYKYQVPARPTDELRFIYDSANGVTPEHIAENEPHIKPFDHQCHWQPWPLSNVWLGVTAENQKAADKRIPILLQIPAAVLFVSIEPMLGPVKLGHMDVEAAGHKEWCVINGLTGQHTDMGRPCPTVPHLDWVICGGETGPGARPMHPDWARALRDQCQEAGVPFFFKQWGEWIHDTQTADCVSEMDPDWLLHCYSKPNPIDHNNQRVYKVGKKVAGRLLDGQMWEQMP